MPNCQEATYRTDTVPVTLTMFVTLIVSVVFTSSDILSVTVTLSVKLILPRIQSGSEVDVIAFMYLRH